MPQENVEVVRRMLEAYSRGDLDEMLTYVDPGVELHSAIIGGAEGSVYRGHEGFRKWYADSQVAFDELRTELTERRDIGGDRVIAFGHIHARGRESRLEFDSPTGWLFTLRGGRVVEAQGYLSQAEALAAAGLSE